MEKKIVTMLKGFCDKKNRVRPVLNHVKIENGILTATNLESTIIIENAVNKDIKGVFSTEQLELNSYSNSLFDVDYFPIIKKITPKNQFSINFEKLIEGLKYQNQFDTCYS
jgi:DNA polymerase III sliding clamp (beta) subunit (PCNA family)